MMKIQFSNKNMTVPDRVYSHAEQRINELDHLFRGEPEAVVVFSAEDGKHVIELTIFSGTTIFRVVEKTSDMLVSKQFEFGPMSVQEAILQMNLIGHSFFAFRNEEKDGAFSVVYRRNDGGYGILVDKT